MKIDLELLNLQSILIIFIFLIIFTFRFIDINYKPSFKESDMKIDINTADEITLQRIPYIGEKTAELILEDRSIKGKYTDINQLKWVKNFDKIKPYITVK